MVSGNEATAPLMALGAVGIGLGLLAVFISAQSRRERARQEEERKQARRAMIIAKYGDTKVAQDIIACRVWIAETAEQLRDSLGAPLDIDQKVLKSKKKEVWKYFEPAATAMHCGLRWTMTR